MSKFDRTESAFLWNYSGMNVGFFIGFTVSGIFQMHQNFKALFLFASIGSFLAFLLALANWKHLKDRNTAYSRAKKRASRFFGAALVILGVVLALFWLLKHASVSNELIVLGGLAIALLFVYFAWKEKSQKISAFLILALSSLVFWAIYQLAPMGLTLFYPWTRENPVVYDWDESRLVCF